MDGEQQWDSPAHSHDAVALLQTTITALHQSIEPAAIRSNVLEVFIAVNQVLHSGDAEWFIAARDAIAGYGYELCALAQGWFSGMEPDWGTARDAAVGQLVWVSASM